ncbi:tetraacyldisaccharide 4'-kinase [Afipia sp. P52-10]|uniref:tetraacyldisaccharide 4'-kinase n=1 Tax=Afipia sp. P52-10 TaxID=1429916 RepID=UPI0003DF20AC|nr:tetraacyldisaccharide 4'-kinase [Afipia sp. P52-10]ETR78532.1 tetraacyldisaccharide 4'-kinase [Afipia sp. P52-10]
MREPAFWWRPASWMSRALSPVAYVYGSIAARRMRQAGRRAAVPVICVGSYHVGGAGKTPTVMALITMLQAAGETPVVLSRGYGGRLAGPVRVDPARHRAADVGDEPLLLARAAPVIVARDRIAGAEAAHAAGASVIVMDDGFQNPSLHKDLSLAVIDGGRGVGNACVFPAGPLRAPLAVQTERTDALVLVGEGGAANGIAAGLAQRGVPVLRAQIVPEERAVSALQGKRVLAFAGIGDPERFFQTLRARGIAVAATVAFADHHAFTAAEIDRLLAQARAESLIAVTTEKDLARLRGLPGVDIAAIRGFPVALQIDEGAALAALVRNALAMVRARSA